MGISTRKPELSKIENLDPDKKTAINNFIATGKTNKTPKKEYEPEIMTAVRLPKNIHRALKLYTTVNDTTMLEITKKAVIEYMERNNIKINENE